MEFKIFQNLSASTRELMLTTWRGVPEKADWDQSYVWHKFGKRETHRLPPFVLNEIFLHLLMTNFWRGEEVWSLYLTLHNLLLKMFKFVSGRYWKEWVRVYLFLHLTSSLNRRYTFLHLLNFECSLPLCPLSRLIEVCWK